MKTSEIISKSNESLKNVRTDLRDGNREYTSISRVLKDIQRKDMLKSGYGAVFAALNLKAEGKSKVEPADFFGALAPEMWGTDKKGEKYVGIFGLATKKDEKGNVVKDEKGEPVKEAKLRKVTAWSPNKLFKVWAQSEAAKGAK